MNNLGCQSCIFKRDILVPCDWLLKQSTLVVRCPHYTSKEEINNGKITQSNN